jgi:hypothetical protein
VSGIAAANGGHAAGIVGHAAGVVGHAAGVVGWNQAWVRPELGYGAVPPPPQLPGLTKDLMTDAYLHQ